jgi:hypothetical protein
MDKLRINAEASGEEQNLKLRQKTEQPEKLCPGRGEVNPGDADGGGGGSREQEVPTASQPFCYILGENEG